jgi:hypothetical protein
MQRGGSQVKHGTFAAWGTTWQCTERSTVATPLGGRRGRRDRPMLARRVGQGDMAGMAVRRGRVPLRMDQRALAGLGMRAQRRHGADATRRRRGRVLWSARSKKQLRLAHLTEFFSKKLNCRGQTFEYQSCRSLDPLQLLQRA